MYWHIMTAERYDDILALGVVILSRLSFFPPSFLLYYSIYFISISILKMCCEG